MRQFDVFENPSPSGRRFAPYVVVLSSHLLLRFDDAIVAPLANDAACTVPELEMDVEVAGHMATLVVSELSTLEQRVLKRRVGSLLDYEDSIRRALDRLFTGF